MLVIRVFTSVVTESTFVEKFVTFVVIAYARKIVGEHVVTKNNKYCLNNNYMRENRDNKSILKKEDV